MELKVGPSLLDAILSPAVFTPKSSLRYTDQVRLSTPLRHRSLCKPSRRLLPLSTKEEMYSVAAPVGVQSLRCR